MNTAINNLSETIARITEQGRMKPAPEATYQVVGKGGDPTRTMTASCFTDAHQVVVRFTEVAHGVSNPHVRTLVIDERGAFLMEEVGCTVPVKPGNKYYSPLLSIVRGWSMEARQKGMAN